MPLSPKLLFSAPPLRTGSCAAGKVCDADNAFYQPLEQGEEDVRHDQRVSPAQGLHPLSPPFISLPLCGG